MGSSRPSTSSTTTSRTRCSPSCGPSRDPRRGHLSWVPATGTTTREQAANRRAGARPGPSRGGIHESSWRSTHGCRVQRPQGRDPPRQRADRAPVPGLSEDLVVEALARCDARAGPVGAGAALPPHVRGLVEALGGYEQAAADAAWSGDGATPCAVAANPLVRSMPRAERLYAEMPPPIAHICPSGSIMRYCPTQRATPGRPPDPRHASTSDPGVSRCRTRASPCRPRRCCCAGTEATVVIDAGSGIHDPDLPGTELLEAALA